MQDMQQETATAIVNLANATLADRDTTTLMQAGITTLTLQLAKINRKLVDSLNVATTLKEQLVTATGSALGSGGNGGGGWTPVRTDGSHPVSYTHYCWTHGIKNGHTSVQCTRPAAGHKIEATGANKISGRTTKWKQYGA